MVIRNAEDKKAHLLRFRFAEVLQKQSCMQMSGEWLWLTLWMFHSVLVPLDKMTHTNRVALSYFKGELHFAIARNLSADSKTIQEAYHQLCLCLATVVCVFGHLSELLLVSLLFFFFSVF